MGRNLGRYLNFLKNRISKGETGFGIIEVMVATSIIVIALSVLAYTTNLALIDVAYARQRQSATSLADKALEQIKALPYATVAAGLCSSDLSGDSAITTSSSGVYSYGGETIPNSSSCSNIPSPLYPHTSAPPVSLAGTSYTTHVYVTNYNNNISSGIYRAMVVVDWTNPVRHGPSTVRTQTIIFSPQGCLSGSTHPYSAPCEAFFYASGTNGSPGASLSGSILGLGTLNSANLSFPQIQSNLQAQQVSSVQSNATSSGSNYGSTPQGSQAISSYASNDPTSNSQPYSTNALISQTVSPTVQSGTWGSLSLNSTSADTGTTVATSSDSTTNSCLDLAGHPQGNNLPCGNSNVAQGSGAIASSLNLTPSGSSIGNIVLESLGSSSSSLFEAQYSSGTSPTNCSSTSGDGCVHSSVVNTIGNFNLGGLPAPGPIPSADFPTGWNNGSLVSISGFSNQVNSESGVSASSPSVFSSGSISYWNGSGYTSSTYTSSSPLPSSRSALGVSSVTLSDSNFNGQPLSVVVTPNLFIGPTVTQFPPSGSSCSAPNPCSAKATSSVLSGSINYVVTQGSGSSAVTLANFTLNIDLGSLVASTTYQAAPNG